MKDSCPFSMDVRCFEQQNMHFEKKIIVYRGFPERAF